MFNCAFSLAMRNPLESSPFDVFLQCQFCCTSNVATSNCCDTGVFSRCGTAVAAPSQCTIILHVAMPIESYYEIPLMMMMLPYATTAFQLSWIETKLIFALVIFDNVGKNPDTLQSTPNILTNLEVPTLKNTLCCNHCIHCKHLQNSSGLKNIKIRFLE